MDMKAQITVTGLEIVCVDLIEEVRRQIESTKLYRQDLGLLEGHYSNVIELQGVDLIIDATIRQYILQETDDPTELILGHPFFSDFEASVYHKGMEIDAVFVSEIKGKLEKVSINHLESELLR